jgi:hypothetical protein
MFQMDPSWQQIQSQVWSMSHYAEVRIMPRCGRRLFPDNGSVLVSAA